MLKSGDVIVAHEAKLRECLIGEPMGDVRQGKGAARKLIEESDNELELVVVRVERIARARPRKPAFDCTFDDEGGEA
jgi:hypothetical protein